MARGAGRLALARRLPSLMLACFRSAIARLLWLKLMQSKMAAG
jgi:hypothetical protein